jgi:hypothetical protein
MRAAPPLRAAGKNGPKNERIGWRLDQENNKNTGDWQTLGDAAASVVADLAIRRAAWLTRHYRVPPSVATALADLAFTTTGRRY